MLNISNLFFFNKCSEDLILHAQVTHLSAIEEIISEIESEAVFLTLRLFLKDIAPDGQLIVFVP